MATRTEIDVELTGVHLCCQGCASAADAALMNVEGVNSHCDMENWTVTFTAGDAATAQKALGSLAAAGFYGSTDHQNMGMKPVGNVPHGKVNSLRVSGILQKECGVMNVRARSGLHANDQGSRRAT